MPVFQDRLHPKTSRQRPQEKPEACSYREYRLMKNEEERKEKERKLLIRKQEEKRQERNALGKKNWK